MEDLFDLIKVIGKGSFATVFLGKKKPEFKQKTDPEEFAIKIVELENKSAANQFQEPVFLMKNKDCARIINCYYSFISKDSKLYICMEFCPHTLISFLEIRSNKNDLEKIKKLFQQCCEGVKYLHDLNILHRDIKPENILVDFDGDAKLCDFNVMKELEATMAKTQVGTPQYTAPEVYQGKYDKSADIWSLCATFYKIQKGEPPYYNDKVDSAIALAINKLDGQNYEMLTDRTCNDLVFRELINNTMIKKIVDRPSLDDIYDSILKSSNYTSNYASKNTDISQNTGQTYLKQSNHEASMSYSKSDWGTAKEKIFRKRGPENVENYRGGKQEESKDPTVFNYSLTGTAVNYNDLNFFKKKSQNEMEESQTYDSIEANTDDVNRNNMTPINMTQDSNRFDIHRRNKSRNYVVESQEFPDMGHQNILQKSYNDQTRAREYNENTQEKIYKPVNFLQVVDNNNEDSVGPGMESDHYKLNVIESYDHNQPQVSNQLPMSRLQTPSRDLMTKVDGEGWESVTGSKFRMKNIGRDSFQKTSEKDNATIGFNSMAPRPNSGTNKQGNFLQEAVGDGSYVDSLEVPMPKKSNVRTSNHIKNLRNMSNKESFYNNDSNSTYNNESYKRKTNNPSDIYLQKPENDQDYTIHSKEYQKNLMTNANVKSRDVDELLQQYEQKDLLADTVETNNNDFQENYYNERSVVANVRNARFNSSQQDKTASKISGNFSKNYSNRLAHEVEKTVNPKNEQSYNAQCFQETVIMDDTIIADTVISQNPMFANSNRNNMNPRQNNNFQSTNLSVDRNQKDDYISEVQMGQSRDTDFGMDNANCKSSHTKSGRLINMMQELGETDPRLQDTTKSSKIMGNSSLENNESNNQMLAKKLSPQIATQNDSNQNSEYWNGTDYYSNKYEKLRYSKQKQEESHLSVLGSDSMHRNPLSDKKGKFQPITNSTTSNLLTPSQTTYKSIEGSNVPTELNFSNNRNQNIQQRFEQTNQYNPQSKNTTQNNFMEENEKINKFMDKAKNQPNSINQMEIDIYEDDFEEDNYVSPFKQNPNQKRGGLSEEYDAKFLGRNLHLGCNSLSSSKTKSPAKNYDSLQNSLEPVRETIAGEDRRTEDPNKKRKRTIDEDEIEENLNSDDDFEEDLFDQKNPLKDLIDNFIKNDSTFQVQKVAEYIKNCDSFEMMEIAGYFVSQ